MEGALTAITKASPWADLIELRVDYLKDPNLALLVNDRPKPFIVTNRRKEEGGRYHGDEKMRWGILKKAIELDVDYIDVEMRSKRSSIEALMAYRRANHKKTRFILSFHEFQWTPSQKELRNVCDRMSRWEADMAKVVTFARSWEDNLNVLSLISYARERGQKIVAFCMGEKGKMSRIFAPFLGAAWTYASLSHDRASAPGQMTVQKMRDLWERLR